MNKSLIVLAGAAVIIALAAGGFMFLSKKDAQPTPSSVQNNQVQTTAGTPQSLKDLFSSTSAQECTFTDSTGNGGTAFVAGGKMRGEFTTVSSDKKLTTHIIYDGKTAYMWMNEDKTGYKLAFDLQAQAEKLEGQAGANLDFDQKVDYNCKSWSGDNAKFAPPATIKFTDYGNITMPQGTGSTSPDTKAVQCAACDSAPADYRAQCKAALGCS